MDGSTPQDDRPLDPEKLLRMASLVRAVLDEVRAMDPDQQTTQELAALHGRVTAKLHEALPNALARELEEIDLDLPFESRPGGQEVRVAYAGLIGWLGGLFQGLQAAMQMQQVQALHALQGAPGQERRPQEEEPRPRGQYL